MQIVTDRGMDMPAHMAIELNIKYVPLILMLDGKSYRSGVDIEPDEFCAMLAKTSSFPTTSQPSPGDFADMYRCIALQDPDILSIHISSGLSGTINSAMAAKALVPEANVTIVDTKTLSGALGWQVEAAARAVKAGWALDKVLSLIDKVSAATDSVFTVATLKYLIHGGRIGHLKGLLASILNIKPVIGVDKSTGTYVSHGQARTLERAILGLADHVAVRYRKGTSMRFQILHGHNPSGAETLMNRLDELFKCTFVPTSPIAPVLGAHTGPGLVGLVYAPMDQYPGLP